MAKDRVLNVRISEAQRSAYERAAALQGVSVSALVTGAADARAEELLRAHSSQVLPGDVFDALLERLDDPAPLAPSLEAAFRAPRYENR